MFEFFGYLTFRCDRTLDRGGGALILIRSELAVTRLDLTIPYGDVFEAVGLSVRSPLGDMAIICAYMLPNSGADLLAWRTLFACVPTGAAILFCGDFNAHSRHWGSTITNAAGRLISRLVSDFDLILLNDSLPRFIAGPGMLCNNLDLVFLSASLFHFSSFYVGDDSFGSDHFSILCSLDASLQRVRSASRRINIKNLDWPGFRSRCDELARYLQPRLELGDDPRFIYRDFLTGVSSALAAVLPAELFRQLCDLRLPGRLQLHLSLTHERPLYVSGTILLIPESPILFTLLLVFFCLLLLETWECVSLRSLLTQAFGETRWRIILPSLLLVFLSPSVLRSRLGTCCWRCGATSWLGAVFAGLITGLALRVQHILLGWISRTLVLGSADTGLPGDILIWSLASERDMFALGSISRVWLGTWRLAVAVAVARS